MALKQQEVMRSPIRGKKVSMSSVARSDGNVVQTKTLGFSQTARKNCSESYKHCGHYGYEPPGHEMSIQARVCPAGNYTLGGSSDFTP